MSRKHEAPIGRRICQLVAQYRLRIAYGRGKAELYEAEAKKADRLGRARQSAEAKASRNVWGVYVNNLQGKLGSLLTQIDFALAPYNDRVRLVWKARYLDGKTVEQIADETLFNPRHVQRMLQVSDRALGEATGLTLEKSPKPVWTAGDLAAYLTERPTPDYVAAIADLLDYGAVDVTLLETDEEFQDWLASSKKEAG